MESTATRGRRVRKPADAVTNPDNTASFALTSHRVAAAAAKAQRNAQTEQIAQPPVNSFSPSPTIPPSPTTTATTSKQPTVADIDDEDRNSDDVDGDKLKYGHGNGECSNILSVDLTKICQVAANVDGEGMHNDVNVIDIADRSDDEDSHSKKNKDSTADLKHFFKDAPRLPGTPKARKLCILCQ